MIKLENVSVRAGGFALHALTLDVSAGAYAVLMGRTGSGKTTVLEAICGLRQVTNGRIRLGGRDVTDSPPAARQVGLVPQDAALFPTMTVYDHLALGLRVRGHGNGRIAQRVEECADTLGITNLLTRKASGLSGGEQQRVALGRALSWQPAVLCLDEPLSALDDETRAEIAQLLLTVKASTQVTVLHITHSLSECRLLADVALRLEDGRITQASA